MLLMIVGGQMVISEIFCDHFCMLILALKLSLEHISLNHFGGVNFFLNCLGVKRRVLDSRQKHPTPHPVNDDLSHTYNDLTSLKNPLMQVNGGR